MRSLPHDVAALARRYRELLEQAFGDRLLDTVVFGSQARGDADAESDLDIAVVVRDLTDRERSRAIDLALEAWTSSEPRGPMIAPLVWSDRERDELRARERRIALDVEGEGVRI